MRAPVAMLLLLAACPGAPPDDTGTSPGEDSGDSGVADPTGDPATIELAGACPLESRLGGFVVESNPDFSGVDGCVLDGVIPITVLTEVAAEGDCRLLRRENPFCDPACGSDQTCDLDGTCVAYPTGQEAGTVTIAGLVEPVSMAPAQPGNTYYDTSLATPAYAPGALIELVATGGAVAGFTLHGVGFEPLTLGESVWTIATGTALPVTWSAPTASVSRSTVQLTVNVDQHGVTPLFLTCDFVDDGAGEVPASLLDTFLSGGVSGYPNGRVERLTTDRADVGGGCVDLELKWVALPTEVSVDGHTPCDDPSDCPPGHLCDVETNTCE